LGASNRKHLISTLEAELQCRVLVLVTGDRQSMETRIAPDVLPLISEHLSNIGTSERLALFIYTPGGDSIAGWGLVNLIRQYCKHMSVVIPFRSLSCGTLIALGADEIVMGIHGLLSPVDPSVASPFNPVAPGTQPGGPVNLLPVSVEDMIGYLDLARNEANLKSEESMIEVLKLLATQVNPLALGAVYRAREQSSSLATRLLEMHMTDNSKIERIVKRLTQELPTHSYLIGRREAEDDLNLPITEPSAKIEAVCWDLYKDYADWFKLTQPASRELDIGDAPQKRVRYERAAVESIDGDSLIQNVYVADKQLFRFTGTVAGTQTSLEQIGERIVYQGWLPGHDGEVQQ